MRFLVDECLSSLLVRVANEFGFEAHHVAHLARAGAEDRHLLPLILDGDFTLVTNNAVDFRKLYRGLDLHPGLILILDQLPRKEQERVFRELLAHLAQKDLTNKVVEVRAARSEIAVNIHDFP